MHSALSRRSDKPLQVTQDLGHRERVELTVFEQILSPLRVRSSSVVASSHGRLLAAWGVNPRPGKRFPFPAYAKRRPDSVGTPLPAVGRRPVSGTGFSEASEHDGPAVCPLGSTWRVPGPPTDRARDQGRRQTGGHTSCERGSLHSWPPAEPASGERQSVFETSRKVDLFSHSLRNSLADLRHRHSAKAAVLPCSALITFLGGDKEPRERILRCSGRRPSVKLSQSTDRFHSVYPI
jgi:hypothetical protein